MKSAPLPIRSALVLVALVAFAQAHAGTGTYLFNNNLNASEVGAPSLTAVNSGSYGTAVLYGAPRTTYTTSGSAGYANNAGLDLDASSLVAATQYSLEMVVSFAATDGYRKIADTSARASDNGYYVYSSTETVYPFPGGTATVAPNTYEYLVLTLSAGNTYKGYVNGALDFTYTDTGNSGVLNGTAFDFFLDDTHTSGNEYSNVSVGLLRIQGSVLTDQQVAARAVNPYLSATPEPSALAALGVGAVAMLRRRRRA